MKYLLDVNALLGFGHLEHTFHARTANWVKGLSADSDQLMTCAIVELGFVRVLAQVPQYGITVPQARTLLLRLKKSNVVSLRFIADDHNASHLPAWASTARRTTDGHLAQLAQDHGAVLATLDDGIPGSFLIPA